MLNNLDLLEGLEAMLDKEYKIGQEIKCWKHLAEHFEVKAEMYERFSYIQENSPTEDLFEFLKTNYPEEFTTCNLKNGLGAIDRKDVQDVLSNHPDIGK